jgi:hypothetical protein
LRNFPAKLPLEDGITLPAEETKYDFFQSCFGLQIINSRSQHYLGASVYGKTENTCAYGGK